MPRHARAAAELREELARAGVTVNAEGAVPGQWRCDERAGVLPGYYAGAEVAFVGGSLLPYGGHNPIEPAVCGAAVLMGRHHQAQLPAVRSLLRGDGITLVDPGEELAAALAALLGDAARREELGRRALAVAESERGAARRAVERLEAWGLWPAD